MNKSTIQNLQGLRAFRGRNLPYLKRDCDLIYKPIQQHRPELSKPALLKKGLRPPKGSHCGELSNNKSKPALLKKGLRPMGAFFHSVCAIVSKPALLKKGLRQKIFYIHTTPPFFWSKPALLKKGLRLFFLDFLELAGFYPSKPALLKKGLRLIINRNQIAHIHTVETCPT